MLKPFLIMLVDLAFYETFVTLCSGVFIPAKSRKSGRLVTV